MPAGDLSFVRSDSFHTPMGSGLVALARPQVADSIRAAVGGDGSTGHRCWNGFRRTEGIVISRRITLVVACTLAVVTALPAQQTIVVRTPVPSRRCRRAATGGDGDRIVITAGTWLLDEPLMVTHRVAIEGEGWPVLQGAGEHELMRVMADSVRIRGLVFRNVRTSFIDDRAAIRFVEVEGCAVEGSRFEAHVLRDLPAEVRGLPDHRESFHGRRDGASPARETPFTCGTRSRTLIADNDITRHRDGIYLEFARQRRGVRQSERGQFPLRPALHVLRQL